MNRLALAMSLVLGGTALADTAPPKKDPVPDFDGRGNPDAKAGSWVLWIPRVVLFPLYVVNEYVVRRPLGAFVRHAERKHWAGSVEQLLTFGPAGKSILVPTVLIDFGLLPSVGLYYAGDDVGAEGNDLRLHFGTWGPKWINVTGLDRYTFADRNQFRVRGEFRRSQENLFFGLGPEVSDATRSRYGLERVEGTLGYRRLSAAESRLDVEAGLHRLTYISGDCCGDPSLDERLAAGDLAAPPGYRDTYTAAFVRADLTLDSRDPAPAPGSGAYLNVRGKASSDIYSDRSWVTYGATVGAAVDLTGHQRVLKLQAMVEMIDPLHGNETIPFTEYPQLTSAFMPGFVTGWLTGPSTAAAQLGYRWPLWIYLDAQARFTVGNAFGEHLSGLRPSNLRFSYDIGMTTATARDEGFELLFGLGTETVGQGADITSVRVMFGERRGF